MTERSLAHLFLVGFMGSGKSTVGARVSVLSGLPFVDLDAVVEREAGRSIAEIFSSDGEPFFRELETAALSRLDQHPRSIVAVGGGAPTIRANRETMRRLGRTLWLDVSLDDARRRIGQNKKRPLGESADSVDFRSFFERRRAVYALSDARLGVTGCSPDEVSVDVFRRFERFFD